MPLHRVACPALVCCALACSAEGGGPAGSSSGTAGSGGALSSAGGGGSASGGGGAGGDPSCAKGPGYEPSGSPQLVAGLTAKIVDETGAPAANVPVFVCGFGACSKPATTSAQGEVCTLDKASGVCAPGISPGLEITRPALKYGLGIEHVKLAQLLPEGAAEHSIGEVTTFGLPDLAQGVELSAGASATSNGVTLALAPGTKLQHDELVFDTPELQRFRAVQIPVAKAPPAVDPSAGFEILIGTTPVDTQLCPRAALEVPNTAGWPAGTEVELWVHGVSVLEEWAPYGGWAKASGGKVSADGARIVTHAGEGVGVLGLFGIRKR